MNPLPSQIYGMQALFIGPAPASGYHFVTNEAVLNDNWNGDFSTNYNLVRPLQRVQSVSYTINTERTEIKELGKRGLVDRPTLLSPTVNLNFDYLQAGIVNEARLGFYVNYTQQEGTVNGLPFYSNNFAVCSISGFVSRSLDRAANEVHWPYSYRDKRNLFLAVSPLGEDINSTNTADPRISGYNVMAFGNSYITSYRASAAVNSLPRVSVSYLCENIAFQPSGSGSYIPSVDAQTRSPNTTLHYNIPNTYEGANNPSVLLPGDLFINIFSTSGQPNVYALSPTGAGTGYQYPTISNLGVDFSNLSITSYQIGLDLKREPINNLGYKLPIDRRLYFPVFADLSFSLIVNQNKTGSLVDLINKSDDYNISINLRNPSGSSLVGVRYDFRRAKFLNSSFTNSVNQGARQEATFNFSTEIDPDDLTKGFFISGLMNVESTINLNNLMAMDGTDDGDLLLQEDGSILTTDDFNFLF